MHCGNMLFAVAPKSMKVGSTGLYALSAYGPAEKEVQAKCMQVLSVLSVEDNKLHGSLPPAWSSLSEMTSAVLGYNSFTGSVPATWSNWSQVGKCLLTHAASCVANGHRPTDMGICICAQHSRHDVRYQEIPY